VFAVSIATALLPRFSTALARGEHERFSAQLADGISASAFILLPAMVGLYAIGPDIIRLLFEHGRFAASDTLRTAHALSFYAVGILPYGLVYLFTRAYYALGRTGVPLVASCCAVAANIAFDLLLVGPMRESGLALATSIAGCVSAAILLLFLWRRVRPDGTLLKRFFKIALGCGLVFLVAWAVRRPIAKEAQALSVFLPALAGIACYVVYSRITGLWGPIRGYGEDRPG